MRGGQHIPPHDFLRTPPAARSNESGRMKLAPDIEQYIARTFAESERIEAMHLIEGAVIHDGKPAGPRLQRCALLSCRGSLAALRSQVERLQFDYRDVIVEGEYMPKGAKLVRVRDLNEPIDADS
jgi:hypothetical protein